MVVQRIGHQPFTLAVEMAVEQALVNNPDMDLKSVNQAFAGLPRESSKEQILERLEQLPTPRGSA